MTPRPTNPSQQPEPTPPTAQSHDQRDLIPANVLVISENARRRTRFVRALQPATDHVSSARTATDARAAANRGQANLFLIDRNLKDIDGVRLAAEMMLQHPNIVTVIISDNPTLDEAVLAMRSGASDLIEASIPSRELCERLSAAAQRADLLTQREERLTKLKSLCRTLNSARDEVTGQVGDLCSDLLGAYQTLSDQIGDVSLTSELNSLLRQELDIEGLLRTTLEFMLAKVGATNAAIFLPSSSGEFSLGAYINYDCPKDTAEVLLDHLANTMAPKFEGSPGITRMDGHDELQLALGSEAGWIGDATCLITSCDEAGECLAVMTAFRNQRKAFTEEHVRIFEIIARLFSAQLGRVINVHHRHVPSDELLGGFPDEYESDYSNSIHTFDDEPSAPTSFEGWNLSDQTDDDEVDDLDEDDDYGLAA